MASTFKRRGIKAAVIGAVAVTGLVLSTTSASAYQVGNTWVGTANCEAWVDAGPSYNLAHGRVYGVSGDCEVRLIQRNIYSTNPPRYTGWYSGTTEDLYYNDGTHQLQVEVHDLATGQYNTGGWV
jgi:hypothetical protein